MKKPTSPKKLPTFKSDAAAEAFVERADLSQYDLSGGEFVRFELKPKDKTVNLRLPGPLLDAVRMRAKRAGVPYQRFIRMALEQAVRRKVNQIWQVQIKGLVSRSVGTATVAVPHGKYEMHEKSSGDYELTRATGPTFSLTAIELSTYIGTHAMKTEPRWPS